MKKGDYVLLNEDMEERFTAQIQSVYEWATSTLDQGGSGRDKLKLVFNNEGKNRAATDSQAASLVSMLKSRNMYVMEMRRIGKQYTPQWLKDIQDSVLKKK